MIIGITGHQEISPPDRWEWVEAKLANLLGLFPPPLTGVTCLAMGADQLFASCIERMGGKVHAVVPFPGYESAFDGQARFEYLRLLKQAMETTILDRVSDSDEEAYWRAGQLVVSQSDVLVAVWDGLPAEGLGGTGDVVMFALEQKKRVIHLNPFTQVQREI